MEDPAPQLAPVVHRRAPSFRRLMLGEVLVVQIALHLQKQRHAGFHADKEIRNVGMADSKVFVSIRTNRNRSFLRRKEIHRPEGQSCLILIGQLWVELLPEAYESFEVN